MYHKNNNKDYCLSKFLIILSMRLIEELKEVVHLDSLIILLEI
jgi:hypothetical protein